MKRILSVISILLLVLALSTTGALAGKPVDNDGDGFRSNVDCNDSDAAINPDATEICDGVDNNCDDVIDEGCGDPTCTDNDGDGYGSPADASCTYAQEDCDDVLSSVNPGAAEVCDNGIDDNCDGQIDEGCSTCTPVAENCSDGTDNDCDGATDCADSDCSGDPACSSPHSGLLYNEYPGNCMSCHNTQFNEMANALHYKWVGDAPDMTNQPGIQQGKLTNAINSYCINIMGDWPVCGSCHVGRGLRPDDPQADNSNIDCLMCHNADYAMARVRLGDGSMGVPVTSQAEIDLANSYVQAPAAPTRTSCLKCHANAGGGDGVKRGDLSMAQIANTDSNFDVHMNMASANVACQDCHSFVNHKVTGKGSDLRATDYAAEVLCTKCHTGMDSGTGHQDAGANRTDADRHIGRVACQACHIDLYAKTATETHRDWEFHHDGSPADGVSGPGHPHTDKAADLAPELLFWDRTSDNYLLGDDASLTYDAAKGTYPTSRPNGDINNGKLYSFKYKTAYQPMTDDNKLIALDTFEYLKLSGDMVTSIESGLANMGLPTSTPYSMITTDTYGLLNHGIPQATTIDCAQCHQSFSTDSDNKLDALGYKLKGPKEQVCNQCHSDKKLPRDNGRMHNHINKTAGGSIGISCGFCHSFERPERGLVTPCDPEASNYVDNVPYDHSDVCN
ncbi:MAG: hypothetical protein C0618_09670 [Desulfuromonas sp.]|nr:MAG: hypothetical protein C0618_09670 [Desulfuromonas sp.]